MPPNKKKGRAGGNNKKQKNQTRSSSSHPSVASFTQDLPSFHQHNERATDESFARDGGYYGLYKQATRDFCNWMKEALPQVRIQTVSDLQRGADTILQRVTEAIEGKHEILIFPPCDVMKALSKSIHYREMFTKAHFGNLGDEGHKYMVDTLKYCRSILKYSQQVDKVMNPEHKVNDNGIEQEGKDPLYTVGGRFQALLTEIDDEEGDDQDLKEITEETIRQRQFPAFAAPEQPKQEIDIEQSLINGDDRFEAICLLQTMNDLMGVVDQHFALLKQLLRGHVTHTTTSPLQLLMECTMVANMATNSIRVAENVLQSNRPHLSSFYHLLALVFLTGSVADVERLIDSGKLRDDPHLALHFVASILECSFHNKGDAVIPGKVKRFVKKLGVPLASLTEEAQKISLLSSMEVQLAMEEGMNSVQNSLFRGGGISPHMWLRSDAYIGNDRCILNTQNLIQKLMDVADPNTKLIGRPGFWGPELVENNPAGSMRGGLDEVFAGRIMPELLAICTKAPFDRIPDRTQLIPVLDLLHGHLKGDRTSPVPAALTFGLHTMLTSIFILQGDGDLARIATYSKLSYKKLFAQLEELCDPGRPPQNAPSFYENVAIFKNLARFAEPVQSKFEDHRPHLDLTTSEQLAFWNPVIGGGYMLYGASICSIGLGSATVDSLGQLRFTLHLYNALKQRNHSFEVPFLTRLDKIFSKTKAVWVGGRPQLGSLCKHFWVAWGMSLSWATRFVSEYRSSSVSPLPFWVQSSTNRNVDSVRDLDEILPEEYSASYRRIVLRDFTDLEDVAAFTTRNVSKQQTRKYDRFCDLLIQVNITRDSMDDDEEDVLPMNFSAVGCLLLEFTNELSKHMGWELLIDQAIAQYPQLMRTGKTMGGRQMKGFTASDLNLKRQGLAHMLADLLHQVDAQSGETSEHFIDLAAEFMSHFFEDIPKEKISFFVERHDKPQNRNPLEGSYPYGRTGKTAADPLQGFFHFKYSKKGTPVVRLIKPGKFTPFLPTEDGDVATPYEEKGSKMMRQRNGKFRHIASFSLEELSALGWDGSMYVSHRGNHAARGRYVPFVVGYDSDSDDEYEPIDIQRGKHAGTIDLSADEVGKFMLLPSKTGESRQLGQIKNAR